MSLLFNLHSRFVIAFLPKEEASLNFMTVVIVCSDFGAQENKAVTVYIFPPIVCHEVMGLDAMILVFWVLSQLLFHLHQKSR